MNVRRQLEVLAFMLLLIAWSAVLLIYAAPLMKAWLPTAPDLVLWAFLGTLAMALVLAQASTAVLSVIVQLARLWWRPRGATGPAPLPTEWDAVP